MKNIPRTTTLNVCKSIIPDEFHKVAQKCYLESVESFSLFEDKELYQLMMVEVGRAVYNRLQNK